MRQAALLAWRRRRRRRHAAVFSGPVSVIALSRTSLRRSLDPSSTHRQPQQRPAKRKRWAWPVGARSGAVVAFRPQGTRTMCRWRRTQRPRVPQRAPSTWRSPTAAAPGLRRVRRAVYCKVQLHAPALVTAASQLRRTATHTRSCPTLPTALTSERLAGVQPQDRSRLAHLLAAVSELEQASLAYSHSAKVEDDGSLVRRRALWRGWGWLGAWLADRVGGAVRTAHSRLLRPLLQCGTALPSTHPHLNPPRARPRRRPWRWSGSRRGRS